MGLFARRTVTREESVPAWVEAWFLSGQEPTGADHLPFFEMRFGDGPEGERLAWLRYADELVPRWVAERPGTRPGPWWRWSAPEGRAQLRGPVLERGALGDQLDDEGLPLCLAYLPPAAPVVFESEAACLKRLGVLLPGEAERVERAALRPVTIRPSGSESPQVMQTAEG